MTEEDERRVDDGGGEVKENKDVMVWNYVMFVLAGWFQSFPKEDVMKRAMETFSHDEIKTAKVAFCDNPVISDLDNKNWRNTDKILE